MWHLTILAYYFLLIMAFCGIAGLMVAMYERWENRNALKLEAGVMVMRDFAPKRF